MRLFVGCLILFVSIVLGNDVQANEEGIPPSPTLMPAPSFIKGPPPSAPAPGPASGPLSALSDADCEKLKKIYPGLKESLQFKFKLRYPQCLSEL
ncbi:exported hypothetical protein [Candidatus Terasakiella magnetica]|uniref:Uncharacterized protein n=1 Tax=Candidatus Terasakiella magnetica TaxID=1867952 RepID=A0A1C3RCT4_9PROT|nr:hypothetical protein [Candidatus Terasakiella magnetica]SCA55083.1 exported hypothetical protein [Candidatus Terasakiella magnetica]